MEKFGRDTGMTVPDGYFENFSKQFMDKLPEYPEAPRPKPLSTWQRIKPYVYMAAMFAGIWCMMKMFHMVSQNAASVELSNPPANVVLAMEDADTYEYLYEINDEVADFDLESDLSTQYDDIEDFASDFGYEFKPEYASIEIQKTQHT